jgi:hypothetical protein
VVTDAARPRTLRLDTLTARASARRSAACALRRETRMHGGTVVGLLVLGVLFAFAVWLDR